MKRKRHTEEQIISILKEAESGLSTADLVRKYGISEQTFYRWKKKYGGMCTDQLKELKRLQKENERLRKAVSDLTLDKLILAEAARGNFCAPLVAVLALIVFVLS